MDDKFNRILLVTLYMAYTFTIVSTTTQTFYMVNDDGSCSNSSLSAIPSGKIVSQNDSTYANGTDCEVMWASALGSKVLVIVTLDLADKVNGTCVDFLEINGTVLMSNSNQTLCGNGYGTNQVFEYDDTRITFSFVTQDTRTYSGQGFTAVVTAFTEKSGANCPGTDFLCDNNRCISTSLECDGEQNCVDNSDEASCSSTTGAATSTAPSSSTSVGATTSSAANVTSSDQSTTQSPISSSPSATTQSLLATTTQKSEEKSTFPGLGEKAVLVIIILSSAVVVTIIITAIVYKVWCTQNVVHPVLKIEEAPTTSFQPAAKPGPKPLPKSAPKPGPEPAPKPAPEPGSKPVPRGKAPTSEQTKGKQNPAKKTPPKKSLKKDAW